MNAVLPVSSHSQYSRKEKHRGQIMSYNFFFLSFYVFWFKIPWKLNYYSYLKNTGPCCMPINKQRNQSPKRRHHKNYRATRTKGKKIKERSGTEPGRYIYIYISIYNIIYIIINILHQSLMLGCYAKILWQPRFPLWWSESQKVEPQPQLVSLMPHNTCPFYHPGSSAVDGTLDCRKHYPLCNLWFFFLHISQIIQSSKKFK